MLISRSTPTSTQMMPASGSDVRCVSGSLPNRADGAVCEHHRQRAFSVDAARYGIRSQRAGAVLVVSTSGDGPNASGVTSGRRTMTGTKSSTTRRGGLQVCRFAPQE